MSDALLRASTFSQYCLDALRRRGEGIAFSCEGRHLTGLDSYRLTNSIAAVLEAHGVSSADGVCVLSGNVPEAYLAQVATQMLGGRHTGLHPMGSLADHRFILEDSEARTLIYEPHRFSDHVLELVKEAGQVQVFSLGPGPVGVDILALAARKDAEPSGRAGEDDVAFIFYTGGTTGTPKGVVHSQRSWYHQSLLVQANWQWPVDPVLLVTAPITHAAGAMVAPALALGGRIVLVDGFVPHDFLSMIEAEKVSVTFLVPTMIYKLLDDPETQRRDLSSLKTLVYGAAAISVERLKEARQVFGDVLLQGYGQTEIGVGASLLLKEDHRDDAPDRLASVGRTPPGVTAIILDDEDQAVPVGEPGELCFRSASVMVGYWKLPELTDETLRNNWLHTGDIAVMDSNGYSTIVDRKKDMVVSGGFNVYPKEVEEVLQTHPAVAAVAVIGVPDPMWGEAVVAVVCPAGTAVPDQGELKAWVRERKGPIYTPKHIKIVDELPQTALGKIDKKAILAAWSGHSHSSNDMEGRS